MTIRFSRARLEAAVTEVRQRAAAVLVAIARAQRGYREFYESLPLASQLRIAAIAAVAVTLLVVETVAGLWETVRARGEVVEEAQTAAERAAERPQGSASAALADLDDQAVLAAWLFSSDGEIVARFEGRDAVTTAELARLRRLGQADPEGLGVWGDRVLGFFAFGPMVTEQPVDLGAGETGTVRLLIDNAPIWTAVLNRLAAAPLALLVGCILAALAAGSLAKQIVEPLAQLADQTRPERWKAPGEASASTGARANELAELAANFDVLTSRLAEYERDHLKVRNASAQQIIERTRELEARVRTAEAVVRSKDEFLANMSHEIRTPMNGVLGMAELLAGTDLDRRQRRFVDSMRTAAETMMQIINDILDDSKIAAGKMELVREPFDVREMIEQIGQVYAGRAEIRKLELICRVEHGVPRVVVGDVLRLRQVLGNLISNAVKYTERGEVLVRVAVDAMRDGQCRLHFGVADTGPGIPDEQQAAIFEAFTQLDNGTRVGGTGLGLSIANRLVRLLGGEKIDLISQQGHGSSFSFVLPFAVSEAAPETGATNDEFRGTYVLVIEDNTASYMYLEEMLENWSADVSVANRGKAGFDRLLTAARAGQNFDVVLLDHSLPDATTAEMLRRIRREPMLASTYVILLSAFDFDAPEDDQNASRPDVCIPKPVQSQQLRAALQTARQPPGARAADTDDRAGEGARGGITGLGLTVLVADDNAINREVASVMLERLRCRVEEAEDGRAAVHLARAGRFDAILMDCQMPGMDGYAATAAIRREESERGKRPTPIIALTANVMARDRERCLAAGMNSFLAKPFTSEQLAAALRPVAEERGTLVFDTPESMAEPRSAVATAATPSRRPASADEQSLTETQVADMLDVPLFEPEPAPRADLPVTVRVKARPVLDVDQVNAIRALGRPQVLERLCTMLFEAAPATLQRIDSALASGDLETVAAAAHSIKSAIGNLGGRELAEQLDRCETEAREHGDLAAARSAAAGLREGYAAVEAALRMELQRATGT